MRLCSSEDGLYQAVQYRLLSVAFVLSFHSYTHETDFLRTWGDSAGSDVVTSATEEKEDVSPTFVGQLLWAS